MYFQRFPAPSGPFSVIIEDDDRVAYGYLLKDEHISGDVWLYNVGKTPTSPEWDTGGEMPFRNSQEFTAPAIFRPLSQSDDVTVAWTQSENKWLAKISLRGQLHALVTEGSKPGWCVLALKSGPIARTLRDYPERSSCK